MCFAAAENGGAEAIHRGLGEMGLKSVIDREIQGRLVVTVQAPGAGRFDFTRVPNRRGILCRSAMRGCRGASPSPNGDPQFGDTCPNLGTSPSGGRSNQAESLAYLLSENSGAKAIGPRTPLFKT